MKKPQRTRILVIGIAFLAIAGLCLASVQEERIHPQLQIEGVDPDRAMEIGRELLASEGELP